MNAESEGRNDEDGHRRAVILNVSARKLDVYEYERLAYTQLPTVRMPRRRFADGARRLFGKLLRQFAIWNMNKTVTIFNALTQITNEDKIPPGPPPF